MTTDHPSHPPFCPFIYTDGRDIFLEFLGKDGTNPHVLRFAMTEGGLHKALKHVPNVAAMPGFITGNSNVAGRLLANKIKPKLTLRDQARRRIKGLTNDEVDAALQAMEDVVREKIK